MKTSPTAPKKSRNMRSEILNMEENVIRKYKTPGQKTIYFPGKLRDREARSRYTLMGEKIEMVAADLRIYVQKFRTKNNST